MKFRLKVLRADGSVETMEEVQWFMPTDSVLKRMGYRTPSGYKLLELKLGDKLEFEVVG
jgi:hypothetical protein